MDGERHQRLWRLVTDRARGDDRPGWVGLVCAVAVDLVGVDGAAVSLRTPERAQELAAASDPWAQLLEELQYTVGEGPGVEAFATAGPVLVADLSDAGARWPGFVDSATGAGLAAVFAFPLQEDAIRLGTLDLYRRGPGGLSAEELADAVVLADLATTALLTDSSPDTAALTREDAPGHYDDVNVATGMLATDLRIGLDDAFLRLRAHAFSDDRPCSTSPGRSSRGSCALTRSRTEPRRSSVGVWPQPPVRRLYPCQRPTDTAARKRPVCSWNGCDCGPP